MNTMKKILAFAMIVSMVLGCFIISTSAAEKKTYVGQGEEDGGLVAWYDASNNANGTQDPQSNLWKDLSGNVNHIDISAAVSAGQLDWQDNKLIIKDGGCYLRLPEAVCEELEGNAYTIEIVTGELQYTATEYITLLSSANDELSVFIRCSGNHAPGQEQQFKLEYKNLDKNGDSNRPFMYDAWDAFNGKTLSITSDLDAFDGTRDDNEGTTDTDNVIMYSDGTRKASGESEFPLDLGGYVYFGQTAETREWHGEIYALRIYNRALTPEEVSANAAADQWNYRGGQKFEPTEQYDPELDKGYIGFKPLEGYNNKTIVFNEDTDLIPLTGFYGAAGLLDYLYPFESDEPWVGARLERTEEEQTDVAGEVITGCSFDVLYESFCTRANITPLVGKDCQYIVVKLILDGTVEDFNMNVIGYDKEINDTVEYATESLEGGIDNSIQKEVQYVTYDVATIFDDCEAIQKFYVDIVGMTNATKIYLQEIAMFATEKEAVEYTGATWVEPETDDDDETTVAEEDDTTAPEDVTTAKPADTTAKPADTTTADKDEGGCASVVGFGAAAVMVAAAAAVVLKKKD